MAAALDMGARPPMKLTIRETEDREGDAAAMGQLAQLLRSSPGRQAVVVTVRTLSGERRRYLFRVTVSEGLRREVALLLVARPLPPRARARAYRRELVSHLREWKGGQLVGWLQELREQWGVAPVGRWLAAWRLYEREMREAAEAWPHWREYLAAYLAEDEREGRAPWACWPCAMANGEVRDEAEWWRTWGGSVRPCPLHVAAARL